MHDPDILRPWRGELTVKILLTLAAKFASLFLLWFLFFRGGRP